MRSEGKPMTALTITEKRLSYDRIKISYMSHIQNFPVRNKVSIPFDNLE
jgi:hypothetical protein